MRFIQYFIAGMAGALLLTLGLFYALLGQPGTSSEGIYQTHKIKHQLMQTIEPPRLIFVGGSGTLMGIGTDLISKSLNINTVNFGIYAGLDLEYQLYLLEELIQPGDRIVFAFEYSAYNSTQKMSANTRNYVTQRDRPYFLSLPFTQQLQQALSLGPGGLTAKLIESLLPSVPMAGRYPIENINLHGDQTINRVDHSPLNENEAELLLQPVDFQAINQNAQPAFDRINQFIDRHRTLSKASFYMTFPNLWDHPQHSRHEMQVFEDLMLAAFAANEVPVLGRVEDFLYGFDSIYDTLYHLNAKGVDHRSSQLAALLRPYFNESSTTLKP